MDGFNRAERRHWESPEGLLQVPLFTNCTIQREYTAPRTLRGVQVPLVTTSDALVTSSVALVSNSFLLLLVRHLLLLAME